MAIDDVNGKTAYIGSAIVNLRSQLDELTQQLAGKFEEHRNHYLNEARLARAAVEQFAGLKTDQEMAQLAQSDPYSPEANAELQTRIDLLKEQIATLDATRMTGDQIDAIQKSISTLFAQPGIDAEKAGAAVQYYFDLFQSGQISIETLINYLQTDATETWYRYADAQTAAAASLSTFTEAQLAASAAVIEGSAALVANTELGQTAAEVNAANAAAADEAAIKYQQLATSMAGMNAIAAESVQILKDQTAATLAWSAAQSGGDGGSGAIANSVPASIRASISRQPVAV
jgi:chaperonin cofactor prefoldin